MLDISSLGLSRTALDHVIMAIADLEKAGREDGDLNGAWVALNTALTKVDGLQAGPPNTMFPRMAQLPFDGLEALAQMAMNRVINERLMRGYYRDRLVVFATQEKSASTLHEVAMNEMLRHTKQLPIMVPTPRQHIAGPSSMTGGVGFHVGKLQFFPNGGTLRGVFEASRVNLWLLDEIGSKVVVLTRHPADRMVAQYCMRKGEMDDAAAGADTTAFRAAFLDIDLPRTVDPLIYNLRWIGAWQKQALKDERVLIVRYEDMLADAAAHFERIHTFLFNTSMDSTLIDALTAIQAQSGEGGALQSGDAATRNYAKGYSGKVGVWRDYLSHNDIADYNSIADDFSRTDPVAKCTLALYPDLVLQT